MSKLTLYPVTNVEELIHPVISPSLSLNSPAVEFFTDFAAHEPLVINAAMSAADAYQTMLATHVRLKLVVDEHKHFIGVISSDDLSEQNIVRHVTAERTTREAIKVVDLMAKKQDLLALSIREVSQASIGDVVTFLKDNYRQHCLVIDEESHKVRGMFSASDISRKLHLPVDIRDQSSFYRVFSAVS